VHARWQAQARFRPRDNGRFFFLILACDTREFSNGGVEVGGTQRNVQLDFYYITVITYYHRVDNFIPRR